MRLCAPTTVTLALHASCRLFIPLIVSNRHDYFRLCRLALLAPPPTIIFILGLCTALLRKHPECKALIHRQPVSSSDAILQLVDGFDANTDDPAEALRTGE